MSLGEPDDLWYGSGPSVEAEQVANQDLVARVGRVVGAKPFPASAMQLAQMTRDPRSQMDDLLQVLESDPGLSTRLLRLVNSAGFALRIPCTSVRHAAVLVGNSRLNQVATSAAILDMYDSSVRHAGRILEHATVVGSLCRYLAFYLALPSDDLFTCGFLHDIGKLMLLDTDADAYAALLDRAADEADKLHPLEREKFGFDHALLGGHVLQKWNIPDPIPKVVAWHHNAAHAFKVSSSFGQLVCAVRLADAMSYAFKFASADSALERLAQIDAATYLGVSEAQLAAMWDEMAALAARSAAAWRNGNGVTEAISIQPTTTSLRAVRQALSAAPRTASSEPPPALRAASNVANVTAPRAHAGRSLAPTSSRSGASRTLESMSAPLVMTSLREARSFSLRPDVGLPSHPPADAVLSPLPPDARVPASAWPLVANQNAGSVETESWPAVIAPSDEPISSGPPLPEAAQLEAPSPAGSPEPAAAEPEGPKGTHAAAPAPGPDAIAAPVSSVVSTRVSGVSGTKTSGVVATQTDAVVTSRTSGVPGAVRLPVFALLALGVSLGLLSMGAIFAPAPPLTRLILVLAAASTAVVLLFTRRAIKRRHSLPSPSPQSAPNPSPQSVATEPTQTEPSAPSTSGTNSPADLAAERSDTAESGASSGEPVTASAHLERVQAHFDATVLQLDNLLRSGVTGAAPETSAAQDVDPNTLGASEPMRETTPAAPEPAAEATRPLELRGNTADTVMLGFKRSRKKERADFRKAFRSRR